MSELSRQRFVETAQPGDLVFFAGKGLVSTVIRVGAMRRGFTFREAPSHVGIVVEAGDILPAQLLESTTLNSVRSIATGRITEGVSTVRLQSRFDAYRGKLWVRRAPKLTAAQRRALREFSKAEEGKPYEGNLLELLDAEFDIFRWNDRRVTESQFCSELVGRALQYAGFSLSRLPDQYSPARMLRTHHPPSDLHLWGAPCRLA